jgi:CRAL/TRIO domain
VFPRPCHVPQPRKPFRLRMCPSALYLVSGPEELLGMQAMWAVISPWLEPRTQAKIQVISSEKQAQQALLATIPPENLIKRCGGQSDVLDPLDEMGEGPWADVSSVGKASRSQWQYGGSVLSASTISADTAVDV